MFQSCRLNSPTITHIYHVYHKIGHKSPVLVASFSEEINAKLGLEQLRSNTHRSCPDHWKYESHLHYSRQYEDIFVCSSIMNPLVCYSDAKYENSGLISKILNTFNHDEILPPIQRIKTPTQRLDPKDSRLLAYQLLKNKNDMGLFSPTSE
jgi:hypothetical protein